MEYIQFFWLLIIVMMMQPLLQKRLLFAARRRRIEQLQKQRGSRVILLVHRQETINLLGFPLMRFIDIHDSEEVLRAIQQTDDDVPVDLVLHTPGGLALAAIQIARALRAHPSKVTVFVPHLAMSGGTLIALAADEIVMSPHSALGPIDPEVKAMPVVSLLKVVDEKPKKDIDDETLILADMGRKAMAQLRATAEDLLARSLAPEAAKQTTDALISGQWTHDYPISAGEARALGLNVSTDMPADILDMMQLYPQAMRGREAVQAIPGRRSRPEPPVAG